MSFARSLLFAAALTLAPLCAAACQTIPRAEASWSSEGRTIPFELYRGNRVVAAGAINGRAVDFILDTGAGVTTVDQAFARRIGLPAGQKIEAQGAGGSVQAELVTGVTLKLGGLTLSNVPVVVIDLADVSKGIGRPADVVLGRELFDNAVIGLDWEAKQMTLASADGFVAPASARKVDLGKGSDRLNTIPVSVEGLPNVTAHLDMGNGSVLSLPKSYWSSKPELSSLPYALSEAGGVGGVHPTRLVTLKQVTFAGTTFTNVPANLSEDKGNRAVDEPNAGIGLLKQFKVTMDLGHDRMYLEPLAKAQPFLRDRAGVRTAFDGKDLTLSFVSPGSPADKAGLKKGDRLVSVDGLLVGPDYFRSAASGWNLRAPGGKVELQLADGRTATVTLADYY